MDTATQPDLVADDRPVTVLAPPTISTATLWRAVVRCYQYRDLLYTLSLHRLQVRYKQSLLGWGWALLQPLALMVIYTVIFSQVARVDTHGIPYALFAYSGLLMWTCFATAISTATQSLVSHSSLVTKVYFPREILPVSYVVAAIADLAAGALTLVILLVYYRSPLTIHLLYAVPAVVVLMTFALAVSVTLSAIQVRFRDIGIAMPLLLQVWMFSTPVVYPSSALPGEWRSLQILNPLVGVVETFRSAVVDGSTPPSDSLAAAAVVTVIALPLSLLYFKRVEATVADVL